MEINCKTVLQKLNLEFTQHYFIKRFYKGKECRFYVDFYLPKEDIIIEYNGLQHYVSVEVFGGEKKYKRQYTRDRNLEELCKNGSISSKLLVISYKDNNRIEEVITTFLSTGVDISTKVTPVLPL